MEFKVNGQSVSSNKLGDAILSSMQGEIQSTTEKQGHCEAVVNPLSSSPSDPSEHSVRGVNFEWKPSQNGLLLRSIERSSQANPELTICRGDYRC